MRSQVHCYIRRKLQRSVSETETQENFATLASIKMMASEMDRSLSLSVSLSASLSLSPSLSLSLSLSPSPSLSLSVSLSYAHTHTSGFDKTSSLSSKAA